MQAVGSRISPAWPCFPRLAVVKVGKERAVLSCPVYVPSEAIAGLD